MSPEHIAKTRRTGSIQSKETREKISTSLSKERICEYCNKKLKGDIKYDHHVKYNHDKYYKDLLIYKSPMKNSDIFVCPYCNQKIKSTGNLTQHIRARHDKNYKRFE